jgi:periplasmic divalent cation tolerance protein
VYEYQGGSAGEVSDTAEGLRVDDSETSSLEKTIQTNFRIKAQSLAKLKPARRRAIYLLFSNVLLFSAKVMPRAKILVGWTTVDSARRAKQLAAGLVAARLAACVQVDGPIASHYVWKGKQTRTKEWRLWIKFSSLQARALEDWLRTYHLYSTPQWLAVEAVEVAKPYREWIMESTGARRTPKKP